MNRKERVRVNQIEISMLKKEVIEFSFAFWCLLYRQPYSDLHCCCRNGDLSFAYWCLVQLVSAIISNFTPISNCDQNQRHQPTVWIITYLAIMIRSSQCLKNRCRKSKVSLSQSWRWQSRPWQWWRIDVTECVLPVDSG